MEILIDTNIILDSLLMREPFSQEADKILEYCESGKVHGFLACHSLPNIFYILRKKYTTEERKDILFLLCKVFTIVGFDADMVLEAINSENFKDLEDSLQIECAISKNSDYIITRDIRGFTSSKIQALLPLEFINMVENTK